MAPATAISGQTRFHMLLVVLTDAVIVSVVFMTGPVYGAVHYVAYAGANVI